MLFVAAAYHDDAVVVQALKGGRDSLILKHLRSAAPQVGWLELEKTLTRRLLHPCCGGGGGGGGGYKSLRQHILPRLWW